MATVDLAGTISHDGHSTRNGATNVPYVIEATVDIAAAVTAKGSALAQGDVITALHVPSNTLIMSAGFEVITAMTGTSTDLTVDMGITGVDVDAFVDGFDLDAAAAGAYTTPTATPNALIVGGTADTIDLLLATQTGTLLTGVLRVWAVVIDIDGKDAPGEVDRDVLA